MIRARGEPIAGRKSGERDVSEVLAREQVIWPDGVGPVGGTKLTISLSDSPTVKLCYTQSSANAVTVDWGDGTETTGNAQEVTVTHTYDGIGKKTVTLTAAEGETWSPGNTDNLASNLMGISALSPIHDTTLRAIRLGEGARLSVSYGLCACDGLTELDIPAGITTVGNYLVTGCQNLKTIYIGPDVQTVPVGAVSNCTALTKFVADPDNQTLWTLDGVLYSGTAAAICPPGKTGTVRIPTTATSIGNNAFDKCQISGVLLHGAVTAIGTSAFANSKITAMTIPDSVTSIGKNAMGGCVQLAAVTFGSGAATIPENCCKGCTALTSLDAGGASTIGKTAFKGCTALPSFTSSSALRYIMQQAFANCTGLTTIKLTEDVSVQQKAFEECTGLVTAEIGASLLSYYAFYKCTGLRKAWLRTPLQDIYSYESSTTGSSFVSYGGPFYLCDAELALYCEAESKPSNWRDGWDVYLSNTTQEINYTLDKTWGVTSRPW